MKDNRCPWCNGSGKGNTFFNPGSDPDLDCPSCEGSCFDTVHKDEIVCPYCGHVELDSSESVDKETWRCGKCDKEALLKTVHSVAYTTKRCECLNDDTKHVWKYTHKPFVRNDKVEARCLNCGDTKWVNFEGCKNE